MHWRMTLVQPDGTVAVRTLEAPSAQAARESVQRTGAGVVVDVRRTGLQRGRGSVSRTDLLRFAEALHQVLAAGVTLTDAIRALAADEESTSARVSTALLAQLNVGLPPSAAFVQSGLPWPPYLLALLRSTERSGRLAEAFERFVRFESSLLEMRARLVSASLYPLVLLVVSLGVLAFLLGFVVPKFALALDDMRAQLPATSAALLSAGTWVGSRLPELAGGAAALLVALAVAIRAGGAARLLRAAAGRLPVAKDVLLLGDRAQALRICAALLGGGATLTEALSVARDATPGRTGERLSAVLADVSTGQRPSTAFSRSALVGPTAVQLLTAAERTGGLPECLERLAQQDEQRLGRSLERMTTVYGPIVLLAIALVVGGVVVSLYWPLLQLFESVR